MIYYYCFKSHIYYIFKDLCELSITTMFIFLINTFNLYNEILSTVVQCREEKTKPQHNIIYNVSFIGVIQTVTMNDQQFKIGQ